ncbi:MAG: GNAT family N-acetyltransferase [Clostridia bacterium]|nr:GNAT family N-acetyltransferase [Clostridia bacterium]
MIHYRELTAGDVGEVTRLYSEFLNGGEYISRSIKKAWDNGEYMGYIAEKDGKIAGFFTMREGIVFTYPHPDIEEELAALTKGKKVAYCDALLVLPEYREHGTGDTLAIKSSKLLKERGFDCMMAEIWIYPDGRSPAKPVFEIMGKPIFTKRVDGFYRDLKKYKMSCPVCGENCVCGAWVEIIEL